METAPQNAEHALPYRRCVSSDLFTVAEGEGVAEFLAESDAYLSAFAAPVKGDDGKQRCFHCGGVFDGFRQALGLPAVAYVWDIVHGEAHCSGCGWPARGMHYPKGRDGEELFTLRNLFLAYHPDEVTPSAEQAA